MTTAAAVDTDAPLPRLMLRVSLLYLSLYIHYGFFAFVPLWLKSRGVSSAAIGALVAIPLILRILTVAPIAGYVGRRGQVRNAMLVFMLAAAALLVALGMTSGLAAVVVVMLLFSLAWDQIPVLADAYAVMAVRSQDLDFGRIRVWGSIAVVAAAAASGWVIGQLHLPVLPYLIAGLLLLPVAVTAWLPTDNRLAGPAEPDGAAADWRHLLADRPLLAGMLAASLVVGSQGMFNSFSAIQWTAAGISASMIGLLNATAVVSEIAFFWFGKRLLGHRDPRLMLVIAAVAAAVRWLMMAGSPHLPLLIVAQLLQGASATGAILGMMLLIGARAPVRLTSAAQGLNAVLLGVILAVITAASGLIWVSGPAVSYAAMAAVALSALLPLAVLRDRGARPAAAS